MSPTFGRSRATSLRVTPTGSSSRPKPGIRGFPASWAGAMSVRYRTSVGGMAALAWLFGAAIAAGQDVDPLKIPDTQLEPVKWSDLDGWAADDQRSEEHTSELQSRFGISYAFFC